MKRALTNAVSICCLAIGLVAGSTPALGATNAVGPYYATPSWDQTLPAASRFIVLTNMNNEAVLDRETGLVWEQSPSTSAFNWEDASLHCIGLSKGGRQGWRLPAIQDLASLIDPAQSNPALPSGHPFSNVSTSEDYWSATTWAAAPTNAFGMFFKIGGLGAFFKSASDFFAWCVRGGQGLDTQ
jgi:hypothetical protein